MAQHRSKTSPPPDTLAQLESLGDQLVRWVSANPLPVLGTALAILLVAAVAGGVSAWRTSRDEKASAELTALQHAYVTAMGGEATALEAPEPANPETARQVRTEYVERFVSFARAHAGTPAQALAALEASRIYEALDAPDQAREVLQEAANELPDDSAVRAVVLRRLAVLAEAAGDYEAAAMANVAAANTPGYPQRLDALADAARCWAEAAKPDEALALYARLKSEASPDQYRVPPHIEARLAELEARSN